MNKQNPLVTFGLISYKQEKFIEDAVRSALSQDYSPLEIVISDDCSPDGTFSVIEKLVANYKGPHKIIINRNDNNLGLAGNINRMWELASGEFLVIQAGDDISVSERTSCLTKAWLSTDPRPSIVYSNELFIDEQGNEILENEISKTDNQELAIKQTLKGIQNFVIGGCSAGYDRRIHFDVGPLRTDVIAEDFVYSFRALLSNGYIGIDKPLILYRKNDESIIAKLNKGAIPEKRLQQGELVKLIEYKKAIDFYGNVNRYLKWRLNRRKSLIERTLSVNKGSSMTKIYFIFWLLMTGRYKAAAFYRKSLF